LGVKRLDDNKRRVAFAALNLRVVDKPQVWSEKQIGDVFGTKNVDLAPDGKRIVALMSIETAEAQKAQNHVTFLMNFSDELRCKVPIGK
jgi:hypothetical protein